MTETIKCLNLHIFLCCYTDRTPDIQVIRIAHLPDYYFERVVFPGQRLMFEAAPDAQLEIITGSVISAMIADRIRCDRLQVKRNKSLI